MKGYVITVLASITLTLTLFFGGCYALAHVVRNSKTCEQFNIDNWELRACTNIPDKKKVVCNYYPTAKTKTSIFYLHLPGNELSRYINYSSFDKICGTIPQFTSEKQWNTTINGLPQNNLYFKKGFNEDDRWLMILDSTSATLWAEITELH
jgi:hypothetical protein